MFRGVTPPSATPRVCGTDYVLVLSARGDDVVVATLSVSGPTRMVVFGSRSVENDVQRYLAVTADEICRSVGISLFAVDAHAA
jgi:hypothetical protein